ncbi:MAG: aldo/keto reductase [Ruminococcus sp.]|nr:aldo/keto reductase [Ruminococcus sp.]
MFKYELKNDKYNILIPSLTLGTANFERLDNEENYMSFLDKYVELGGNCIDTARTYCSWLEDGENVSENVIGNWMEKRNNRNKIIISTKGGHPNHEDMTISRLSSSDLNHDLQNSLSCLKTDYIDIYFLHRDDENIPVSEIMPILNEFVESGKVHFIGASNWTTKRIQEANEYAEKHNLEPFRISQINYSLAHSSVNTFGDPTLVCMDTIEHKWYTKHQFPVMAFSPQAKGFFAKLAKGDAAKNLPEGQFTSTANLAKLAKVKELSRKTGQSPAVIPLGYLSSQPFFVSSVFAVSKLWQLEENMAAQDLQYDKKTIAFLENMI